MNGENLTLETSLAEQLGLARPALGKLRAELEKGQHWIQGANGVIQWTAAGVAALKGHLAKAENLQKNGGGAGGPAGAEYGPRQASAGAALPPPAPGGGLGWGGWFTPTALPTEAVAAPVGAPVAGLEIPPTSGQAALTAALEGAKKEQGGGARVLVVSRLVVNRRVVLAKLEAPGEGETAGEVTVSGVRDNKLLTPRQRIWATPPQAERGPVWHWHGPHPKRRGQILVRDERTGALGMAKQVPAAAPGQRAAGSGQQSAPKGAR